MARRAAHAGAPLDTARVAKALEATLCEQGTPERAEGEKRYLKSSLLHFGVPVPAVRKVARALLKEQPSISRAELLDLSARLFERGVHELRTLAIALLEARCDLLLAKDLALVEKWIRSAAGWAHVDYLAIRVAGPLVTRFSACRKRLDQWSVDPDFWLRRSSMTALILELRESGADLSQFERYAVLMMVETEFFIRKAIGWVAREASKQNADEVAAFLHRHIKQLSGLSFREGVRRLPAAEQARLSALR